MILLIYIFRWHNIKDEGICDPMEKFELKRSYINEFLNFLEFSGFYFDFSRFI